MSDPMRYWHSKKGKLKIHCAPAKTTRWLHYPIQQEEIPKKLRMFCLFCDVEKNCEFSRLKVKA